MNDQNLMPGHQQTRKLRVDTWVNIFLLIVTAVVGGASWFISNNSFNYTKEISEKQYRAYIGASDIKIQRATIRTAPRIEFSVKNYGTTPAVGVSSRCVIGAGKPEDVKLGSTERPLADYLPQGADIKTSHYADFIIDNNRDQAYRSRSTNYIYRCEITYEDVFNIKHNYSFCYIQTGTYDDADERINLCASPYILTKEENETMLMLGSPHPGDELRKKK